jgi:hypothetical protein
VLAIYDEIYASSGMINHNSYREFVELVGPQSAETAIRLFRIEQAEQPQAE